MRPNLEYYISCKLVQILTVVAITKHSLREFIKDKSIKRKLLREGIKKDKKITLHPIPSYRKIAEIGGHLLSKEAIGLTQDHVRGKGQETARKVKKKEIVQTQLKSKIFSQRQSN